MSGFTKYHWAAAYCTDWIYQMFRLQYGSTVITLVSSGLLLTLRTNSKDKSVCQKALTGFAKCLRRLLLIHQITLIQACMKLLYKLFVFLIGCLCIAVIAES